MVYLTNGWAEVILKDAKPQGQMNTSVFPSLLLLHLGRGHPSQGFYLAARQPAIMAPGAEHSVRTLQVS